MKPAAAEDQRVWPDTRLLDLLGIEVPIIQARVCTFIGASRWRVSVRFAAKRRADVPLMMR
jgi:hypothetical protein